MYLSLFPKIIQFKDFRVKLEVSLESHMNEESNKQTFKKKKQKKLKY